MNHERIVSVSGVPGGVGVITIGNLSQLCIGAIPRGATPFLLSPTGYVIGGRVLPGREAYLTDASEVLGMQRDFGTSIVKLVFYKMDRRAWTTAEQDEIEAQVRVGGRWQIILSMPTAGPYFGVYVAPKESAIATANRSAIAEALRSARAAGREFTHAATEIVKTVVETGGDVFKKVASFGDTVTKAVTVLAVIAAVGAGVYAVDRATGGSVSRRVFKGGPK